MSIDRLSLRTRLLLTVLLPVLLLSVARTGVSLFRGARMADREITERGLAIVSFLAPAAEYGVISGSRGSLDGLMLALKAQNDVAAAVLYDRRGVQRGLGVDVAAEQQAHAHALGHHRAQQTQLALHRLIEQPGRQRRLRMRLAQHLETAARDHRHQRRPRVAGERQFGGGFAAGNHQVGTGERDVIEPFGRAADVEHAVAEARRRAHEGIGEGLVHAVALRHHHGDIEGERGRRRDDAQKQHDPAHAGAKVRT